MGTERDSIVVTRRTIANRAAKSGQRERAKGLRRDQTDAERKFWYRVKARRLSGFKFKRQYPVGPFIADFVCIEARLVVELDGSQHGDRREYDRTRDAYISSLGFRVLRIANYDIFKHLDETMEWVHRELQSTESPLPQLGERAGRGGREAG